VLCVFMLRLLLVLFIGRVSDAKGLWYGSKTPIVHSIALFGGSSSSFSSVASHSYVPFDELQLQGNFEVDKIDIVLGKYWILILGYDFGR
jgi:hypothetical protein